MTWHFGCAATKCNVNVVAHTKESTANQKTFYSKYFIFVPFKNKSSCAIVASEVDNWWQWCFCYIDGSI